MTARPIRPNLDQSVGNAFDRLRAVERRPSGGGAGPWHLVGAVGEPAFQNGWGNAFGAWEDAAFQKTRSGLVLFRGNITGGADGTVVFTLPVGFRPPAEEPFITDLDPNGFAKIHILANGNVVVYATVPLT